MTRSASRSSLRSLSLRPIASPFQSGLTLLEIVLLADLAVLLDGPEDGVRELRDYRGDAGGHEVAVPDPEGNSTTLPVPAYGERVERLERESARVRRELTSPAVTHTVMAEVVG